MIQDSRGKDHLVVIERKEYYDSLLYYECLLSNSSLHYYGYLQFGSSLFSPEYIEGHDSLNSLGCLRSFSSLIVFNYLMLLEEAFRTDNFKKSDIAWLKTGKNQLDFMGMTT